MKDNLHLFPSWSILGILWLIIVFFHMIIHFIWHIHTSRKRYYEKYPPICIRYRSKQHTAQDMSQSSSSEMKRCKNSHIACSILQRCYIWNGTFWKRTIKNATICALIAAMIIVICNSILLKLRTGAYTEQPYEWYSLKATGERKYFENMQIPHDILSQCVYKGSRHQIHYNLESIDDIIQSALFEQAKNAIKVYVVLIQSDSSLMELNESQLEIQQTTMVGVAQSFNMRKGGKEVQSTEYQPLSDEIYERSLPFDSITLFPFVWHFLLSSYWDSRVEKVSPTKRRISLQRSNNIFSKTIDFELVTNTSMLAILPLKSNIIVIAQYMPSLLDIVNRLLPPAAKIGFVSLAREDCNNNKALSIRALPQIKFGLLPYGDCTLVDGDRFSVIPLGPSFEHGFPLNVAQTNLPLVTERRNILNLMVSWTDEKPTRMQALIATARYCDSLHVDQSCVIQDNHIAFKVMQKIDEALGLKIRWVLSNAPEFYISAVKNSQFTLCPAGKNPEQYRIWEALAAGSIPIIEDATMEPGTFYHPAYPESWRCRIHDEVLWVLKAYDAPVLFIKDWSTELRPLMEHYAANPAELQKLQIKIINWNKKFIHHLQAQLLKKSLQAFS